jgi:glycosyltransferase involved in cell wall biosynthesis
VEIMKILQVSNFFKPSWDSGGPARMAYEISKEFLLKGHRITVYTTDGFKSRLNVKKNEAMYVDGLRTYYFKNYSGYLARELIMPTPLYLPIVARKEINHFDIIYIYDFRSILTIIVSYYARKYKIPYVVFPYGALPKSNGIRGKCKEIFDIFFGYNILKKASKVVAQNNHELDECKKFKIGNENIVYISLGINLNDFINLPPKGSLRRRYKIPANEKIILFLGRINRSKGIQLLIKAFYELMKNKCNYRLVIVGIDDGYLDVLIELTRSLDIEEKVIFAGPIYDLERIAAYVDADVFVTTPCFYEETSLAVLEACAAGTPVVISKQNEIPGLIKYNAGFMINYDKKELINAISDILDNEMLREELSKNARLLVFNEFNLNKITTCLENILDQHGGN